MKKCIGLLLMAVCTVSQADWALVTINPDTDGRTVERFISYYDCRERGLKNQDIAGLFGGRAGFYCVQEEDL